MPSAWDVRLLDYGLVMLLCLPILLFWQNFTVFFVYMPFIASLFVSWTMGSGAKDTISVSVNYPTEQG